ncbi:hypothetical protein J7F02_25595 [Streptomyces sp. ISL-112]|uniref:hypothetical protein n=1 Tax=unclassified Streptomyces TaxID=2593676 RepID=UPI001BEA5AEC|nr:MULTISPECIES: hypothetical protein [unclassified Streptomyces]MBT2428907.1 hypothetical protein [Streptomyces sp. ISL-112]MBT2464195.1 hypothetical protein [Streptomyces sp. ISL-63]
MNTAPASLWRGTALRLLLRYWVRVSCVAWCVLSVVVLAMTSASALLTEHGPGTDGVLPSYDAWARTYCLVIGAHLTWSSLPLYVANSMTRRAFSRQALVFAVAITGFTAVLFTVSLGLEITVYAAAGRPHDWGIGALPSYLLESWLVHLVWLVGGAFAAACVYRFSTRGLLVVPFVTLLIFPGDILLGRGTAALGTLPAFAEQLAMGWAALGLLGIVAVGTVLTWHLVRDVPIRPPTR